MPLSYIFSLCGSQKPWSPCVDSYCIHFPGLNNRQWWWFGFLFLQGVAVASASGFLCCAVDDTEMHMIANSTSGQGKWKTVNPWIVVVAGLYPGGNWLCWMIKGPLRSSAAGNGADRCLCSQLSCKTVELACTNSCACKTWLMLFQRFF